MSRIKDVGKLIQENLSLGDYAARKIEEYASKPVNREPINTAKQLNSKKKMTFYLDKDSQAKFNEIFARRLMDNNKTDKSVLICEAIDLLYSTEKKYGI